jgi:hypothetical protein
MQNAGLMREGWVFHPPRSAQSSAFAPNFPHLRRALGIDPGAAGAGKACKNAPVSTMMSVLREANRPSVRAPAPHPDFLPIVKNDGERARVRWELHPARRGTADTPMTAFEVLA